MPSGRKSVGGSVRTQNDGGGTDVSREEKRAGRVRGLQEGGGGRVAGHTPNGTAWESQGKNVELDRRNYRRRRMGGGDNLLDRVPQGGGEGVPSGGLPGKGRDANSDEGTFLAQTYKGRRDHLGGGKPPSSKVPTMRHAGPVPVSKWAPQEHRDVQEWGGEEEASTGGDGGKGKHVDGI